MSIFEDSPRISSDLPKPGEDLYGLSVSELNDRIAVYREEIVRLEAERVKKQAETDAAHAVFR
jgi:uncharacterized small protein (DUF1192 family)